jgi:hypothetical protein
VELARAKPFQAPSSYSYEHFPFALKETEPQKLYPVCSVYLALLLVWLTFSFNFFSRNSLTPSITRSRALPAAS